jgi:hypothetical protein
VLRRLAGRRRIAVIAVLAIFGGLGASALADNIERNFSNSRIHWSDESGTRAWVTLVDKTGPNWPVFAAAITWDNAGRLDVTYRSSDCGGNGHCVEVDNPSFSNFTCRERPGEAVLVYPAFGTPAHLTADTRVRLNQKCADNQGEQFTDSDRRVVTCQEEGHVLGIDHDYAAGHHNTCMAATRDNFDHAVTTPRQHDFQMLDDVIYTHND